MNTNHLKTALTSQESALGSHVPQRRWGSWTFFPLRFGWRRLKHADSKKKTREFQQALLRFDKALFLSNFQARKQPDSDTAMCKQLFEKTKQMQEYIVLHSTVGAWSKWSVQSATNNRHSCWSNYTNKYAYNEIMNPSVGCACWQKHTIAVRHQRHGLFCSFSDSN